MAAAARPRRAREPDPTVALVLLIVAVGAAATLSSVLGPLSAPDSLEARARAIARELTCPVCEGQSVAESNSVVAARMRQEIAAMLQEGRPEEEIVAHYVDLYGPWILARPPARGLYVLLWGAPAVVLLVGALWAFWHRGPARGAPSG